MSGSVIILPMVRVERADHRVHVQARISERARSTLQRLAHLHHGGDLASCIATLLEHCADAAEGRP